MKGLYFYKFASPYAEDVTKDCKLTVNEIDHNFITLKESILNSFDDLSEKLVAGFRLDRETGEMYIEFKDGRVLTVNIANFTKDFSVEFNKANGSLYINHDNIVERVEGLITEGNIHKYQSNLVVTDETLIGDNISGPIGISVGEKTAYFRPVEKLIDKTENGYLPSANYLKKGDRYLTLEYYSPHGYLYNYKSANRIADDAGNGWRVPSKSDWDSMLNAIELCDENKNHESITCNQMFGKVAGQLLKANTEWFSTSNSNCNGGNSSDGSESCNSSDIVIDIVDGIDEPKENTNKPDGVDAYSMSLLPSGYGDGGLSMDYYGTRCKFWTSTVTSISNYYTKRFDYDKSGVVQVSDSPTALLSLRLVKDYDGDNFYGVETINKIPCKTVLMPSTTAKSGYAVWMATNAAFDNEKYCPVIPNGGENMSKIKVYYINEWNGFEWVKRQLVDGDSLVLRNGFDNTKDNEFRIIDGVLVNVNSLIVKEVINKYDAVIADINAHLDNVEEKVDKEIVDRINAVSALQSALDIEVSERKESDEVINSTLTEEINTRIEDVDKLNDAILRTNEALDSEIKTRTDADTELLNALNEETSKREKEIDELWVAYDNNFGTF